MFVRVASCGADFRRCYAATPQYHKKLATPTVMAERTEHGQLLGFIGTDLSQKIVVAGPLYVDQKIGLFLRSRVAFNLVECYEKVLKAVGIKAYHFYVKRNDKQWVATIEGVTNGLKPYDVDRTNAYFWYRREIA